MAISSGSTRGTLVLTAIASAALLGALAAGAPDLRAQADSTTALNVGDPAPDFRASGATRYGLLRDPVTLSEYHGKTVVLAFFFKARTKG